LIDLKTVTKKYKKEQRFSISVYLTNTIDHILYKCFNNNNCYYKHV